MQIALVHRNANELCLVELQLVISLLTSFPSVCGFIVAFPIACMCI